MKYIKLLMLIVTVSFFASCSDDDDYNTNEVTVGFKNATFVTSESAGQQNIPVIVNGNHRNGDIKFRIEVEEVGNEPAIEDEHYYITGKSFNLPADSLQNEVNIEINFVNDRLRTEPRQFKISIVDLKGAEAGISSTTVIINDNDGPEYTYESMFGKYVADLAFNGQPVKAYGQMRGATDSTSVGYNERMTLSIRPTLPGVAEIKMQIPVDFTYDKETNKGVLELVMNKRVATLERADGKTLEFILLNERKGHEKDPLICPFSMEYRNLLDLDGKPIVQDGDTLKYMVPENMKFKLTNHNATLYQSHQEEGITTGAIGSLQFNTLTYTD